MSRRILSLLCAASMIAAVLSSIVVAPAEAKSRPLPRLSFYGDVMPTMGFNAGCRGTVHVDLRSDDRKPGVIHLVVRSGGFTGNGKAWRKDPRCRVGLRFKWMLPVEGSKVFHVRGTPRRGTVLVDTKIRIGSGFNIAALVSAHPVSRGVSYEFFLR